MGTITLTTSYTSCHKWNRYCWRCNHTEASRNIMNFLHFISFKDPLVILIHKYAKLIFIKGKLSGRLLIKEKFAISKTNYFQFLLFSSGYIVWGHRSHSGYVKLQMNAGLFKIIVIVRTAILNLNLKIFRKCFLQVSHKNVSLWECFKEVTLPKPGDRDFLLDMTEELYPWNINSMFSYKRPI